jgi:hypothetical protein
LTRLCKMSLKLALAVVVGKLVEESRVMCQVAQ